MSEKFFKILENLRQKSPETKNTISFSISLAVTLVIAFFWFIHYIDDAQKRLSDNSLEVLMLPIKDISASVNGYNNDSI